MYKVYRTLLHNHPAVLLLPGLFWSGSFLSGTHRHSSREAVDTRRTWDLVVCRPYFAYHWRTDAKWWQQLVHYLLRRAAGTAQRQGNAAPEFISAGSELCFDSRPEHYSPFCGGIGLVKKLLWLWIFNPNFTLCKPRSNIQCYGSQMCTFPHVRNRKPNDQLISGKRVSILFVSIDGFIFSPLEQENPTGWAKWMVFSMCLLWPWDFKCSQWKSSAEEEMAVDFNTHWNSEFKLQNKFHQPGSLREYCSRESETQKNTFVLLVPRHTKQSITPFSPLCSRGSPCIQKFPPSSHVFKANSVMHMWDELFLLAKLSRLKIIYQLMSPVL